METEDIINMFTMSTKPGLIVSEHSSKTRWWQAGREHTHSILSMHSSLRNVPGFGLKKKQRPLDN